MTGKKKIQLSFFYADENVLAKVIQWRTQKRLLTWAESFYNRYGFTIESDPKEPQGSRVKKERCLVKSDGLKIIYLEDEEKRIKEAYVIVDKKIDEAKAKLDSTTFSEDPTSEYQMWSHLFYEVIEEKHNITMEKMLLNSQRPLQFRKQIQKKLKGLKLDKGYTSLVVVFCEFKEMFLGYPFTPPAIGETFDVDEDDFILSITNIFLPEDEEYYVGALVFVDYKRMTKKYEYVLAHEIVHAAGGTTADNHGTKGNIMIYADSENKSPADVNLEPNDKTRLEVAYFVKE